MDRVPPALFLPLLFTLLTASIPVSGAQESETRRPAETPADRISEEIEVREAETLLDLPPVLGRKPGLGADDFEVVVGEVHHRPTKLERLEGGDAHLALYFDATGPDPFPTHLAALALAERAGVLTGMGTVEVVLADPEPRSLTAPTRDPDLVRRGLAAVAGEMRRRRRPAFTVVGGGDPERWQRASAWAAESPVRGPRFLFLVTQGFQPSPRELDALGDDRPVEPAAVDGPGPEDAGSGPAPGPRVERVLAAARALAAAGWVTVPVSLSAAELERRHGRPIEYEDQDGKTAYGLNLVPLIQLLLRKVRGRSATLPVDDEEEHRIPTTPENAALVALARETGGEILGYVAKLDRTLDDLKNRWRLWYAAEALSAEPQPLDVIYLGDGRSIRGRRWATAR